MESKNKEIRCCFFDMGNVLVYFSHEIMFEQIGSLCDRSGKEIQELLINSGLFENIEVGKLTELDFHQQFEALVNQHLPFEALKDAASDIFKLNVEMVPLLEELKELGLRLIVLSNTGKSHFEFIKNRFEILDFFDDYTLSYQVGALKPSSLIYHDALEKSGFQPEECFYTDDILKYIEAARELGIESEQYLSTKQLRNAMRKIGIPLRS